MGLNSSSSFPLCFCPCSFLGKSTGTDKKPSTKKPDAGRGGRGGRGRGGSDRGDRGGRGRGRGGRGGHDDE